jgi:hypothetical protein
MASGYIVPAAMLQSAYLFLSQLMNGFAKNKQIIVLSAGFI